MASLPRIAIFDHASAALGGAQFVSACMGEVLSGRFRVDMIHGGLGYRLQDLERAFDVDLGRTTERIVEQVTDADGFGVPGRRGVIGQLRRSFELTGGYDVFIYSGLNCPPFCFAKTGLAYVHFPMESIPCLRVDKCQRGALAWSTGGWGKTALYGALGRWQFRRYGAVLCNSEYTAGWVRSRWNRPAEVLYPPVTVDGVPGPKTNRIVSLGRFTSGRRSKGQVEQVLAFREFQKKIGDSWNFCMIGFCAKSPDDRAYLRKVQEIAGDLPITIVLDGDREQTAQYTASAKIFWHTSGLGVDEQRHPECAEHFGIATVEAMAAGCVPVVVASGGQREIIQHARSGFLAGSLSELVESSVNLAKNEFLCQEMAAEAVQRSRYFSKKLFQERLLEVVIRALE